MQIIFMKIYFIPLGNNLGITNLAPVSFASATTYMQKSQI